MNNFKNCLINYKNPESNFKTANFQMIYPHLLKRKDQDINIFGKNMCGKDQANFIKANFICL